MKNYKDDLLQHYGIPGQKHGKRRFQNEDGSLTAAGRARYAGGGTTDGGHGILNVRDQRAGERSSKTMTKEERMKNSGPSRDTRTTVTKNGTRLTERTNDKGESILERRYADGHYHTTYEDNYGNMTQTTGRRGSDGRMRVNKEQYKVTGDDIEAVNRRKTRNIQGEKHEVVKGGAKQAPAQRTSVARNPREMGVGAARKLMDRSENGRRTISRLADNGDVVIERKNADGTAEVIRQAGRTKNSSRTDSYTVYGKHGANRETYKVVGEDDIINRRVERGIKGEKHEVVKGGNSAAQRANAGARTSAINAVRAYRDQKEAARNARIDASGRTTKKKRKG